MDAVIVFTMLPCVLVVLVVMFKLGLFPESARKFILKFAYATGILLVGLPFAGLLIVGLFVTPAPLMPIITYGEFPFRLEYKVSGERFVIEDVVVAEFEASRRGNATARARRIWTTRLRDGDMSPLRNSDLVMKHGENIRITFRPGLAEYYMGDLGEGTTVQNPSIGFQPRITVSIPAGSIFISEHIRVEDAHDILKTHGIMLICWKYTPPIENRFIVPVPWFDWLRHF